MSKLDLTADIIDIRDIIERFEELDEMLDFFDGNIEKWRESLESSDNGESEIAEYLILKSVLDELRGMGGDEQWRGDWYPLTLIRDSHFTEYARELVEDIGDLPKGLPNYIEVDWEGTAKNIRMDYTSVDISDQIYWYR